MFSVKSPGELIASVAPILGFEPVESLVLVTLAANQIATVMRLDLSAVDDQMGELAAVAGRGGATGVVAVVVSADLSDGWRVLDSLGAKLDIALGAHGVSLLGAYLVDRVAEGGRWACSDGCGLAGVLSDPAASVFAAAATMEGRRMYGSRAAITDLLAVDAARAAAVLELIDAAGDQAGSSDAAIGEAVAAVRQLAAGESVSDAVLARVGVSLVRPLVRDTLLTLVGSELDADAGALWILLARVLPSMLRAEALAMVAFGAYAHGDGPLAGEAVNAALAANPGHNLAWLLNTALRGAIKPAQIRELVEGLPPAMRIG